MKKINFNSIVLAGAALLMTFVSCSKSSDTATAASDGTLMQSPEELVLDITNHSLSLPTSLKRFVGGGETLAVGYVFPPETNMQMVSGAFQEQGIRLVLFPTAQKTGEYKRTTVGRMIVDGSFHKVSLKGAREHPLGKIETGKVVSLRSFKKYTLDTYRAFYDQTDCLEASQCRFGVQAFQEGALGVSFQFPTLSIMGMLNVDVRDITKNMNRGFAFHTGIFVFGSPKYTMYPNMAPGGFPLSPYWAQEYIGLDFSSKLLENSGNSPAKAKVGVYVLNIEEMTSEDEYPLAQEVYENKHLEFNVNLITRSFPSVEIHKDITSADIIYVTGLSLLKDIEEGQAVDDERVDVVKVLQNLAAIEDSSDGVPPLIVVPAGNTYEGFDRSVSLRDLGLKDVIVVGSLTPEGLVAHDSEASRVVTLTAPSSELIYSSSTLPFEVDGDQSFMMHAMHVYSPEQEKSLIRAGKTDGAAALVVGALADFIHMAGLLTGEQAKMILQKTSLPVFHEHQDPQFNGAGALNAYKLLKLADTIRSGQRELANYRDDSFYDFSQMGQELMDPIILADRGESAELSDEEILSRSREIFFLDHTIERPFWPHPLLWPVLFTTPLSVSVKSPPPLIMDLL